MKKARRFAAGLVRSWSGRRGSNPRPRPWQGRALPAEPRPHRRGNIILEVSVARNPRFQKSSQKYFRNLSLMVGELLVDYLLADAENFQSSKHSWAISSGGEHYLDTVGVTSSNLVSPTMNSKEPSICEGSFLLLRPRGLSRQSDPEKCERANDLGNDGESGVCWRKWGGLVILEPLYSLV